MKLTHISPILCFEKNCHKQFSKNTKWHRSKVCWDCKPKWIDPTTTVNICPIMMDGHKSDGFDPTNVTWANYSLIRKQTNARTLIQTQYATYKAHRDTSFKPINLMQFIHEKKKSNNNWNTHTQIQKRHIIFLVFRSRFAATDAFR